MFDAIAGRYDFLNHVLSAGLDRRWRKRAIAALNLTGTETVLDVCTGTADLALAALEPSRPARGAARVLGVDFAAAMLERGKEKVRGAGLASSIGLVRGDATRLPVCSASVHAVTIAFGIRNVEQPAVACAEMARVLRPGGTLVILEFSTPRAPILRSFYLWYFRHALPLIGRLISKHPSAYSYLPASVGAFPPPEAFARQLRAAGFGDVRCVPLSFGIVSMFVAKKE
jgi:demethylmenaquinone methyltransferase/2-methoxy-6-polyprenyl-1,4-benzoquinol methylase